MSAPTVTGSGASVLTIARSVDLGVTVVVVVDVLFARFKSALAVDTVAVLERVPSFVGVTTMVTVSVALFPTVPRSHAIAVVPEHDPFEGVTDFNVTSAGSVSATWTAAAAFGPAFWTVSV